MPVQSRPAGPWPVGTRRLSTARTHRENVQPEPVGTVFPVVHTTYDFYEPELKENQWT